MKCLRVPRFWRYHSPPITLLFSTNIFALSSMIYMIRAMRFYVSIQYTCTLGANLVLWAASVEHGHIFTTAPLLKPGFHMSVRITPVVSNNVQRRSGPLYGNITQAIADDAGDSDDLDRPDRTELYPDDRGRLSRPGGQRSSG